MLATLQGLLLKGPVSSKMRLGRGAQPERVEPAPGAGWSGRPLRLLVAEDNPINQMVVVGMLAPFHQATVVDDGRKAVEAFKDGAFDAVLMDVSMPEVDGYAAARAIREYELAGETPSHVPIIAITAHAMSEDSDRCLQAGMDAYLPKPIKQQELYAVLEGVTAKNGVSRCASLGPALFDPERILSEMGKNKQMTHNVITASVEHLPLMLGTVCADIKSGDPERILQSIHKLKGSLVMFNDEAAEKAKQIELAVKARKTAGVDAAVAELSEMTYRLVDEMRNYKDGDMNDVDVAKHIV